MTEDAPAGEFCEVIVTAPDADWLAAFVQHLVEERLAAACHILAVQSIYRWQGAVEDRLEARATIHTRTSLVQAIVNRAKEVHPYQVPCVIALPICQGSESYLAWVASSTMGAQVKTVPFID